jgi:3-oxoadipate enol-lactonase
MEVQVPGATLVGDRWAGGGPAIVLLHAGVCDRRGWAEVGEHLASRGFDVIAYDRRGVGEVPPADEPYDDVDDLLAVLDAVSPNSPSWLLGSSMGGRVALDAALTAPERVARLVLIAPAISGDPEPDDATIIAATNGLAQEIDDAWTAGDLEACNRLEVHLWLDGPAGPEGRVGGPPRELAFEMNRIVLANGEPELEGAGDRDAAGRLSEISVPVVVACGTLDVPTKIQRSTELAESVPHGTYRALPGRAHLPYLEAPEEVAALVPREAAG